VTGWIVDVEDYPRLAAERLQRLSTIDPSACRARVEERFSQRAMVAGYTDVFERVAADR